MWTMTIVRGNDQAVMTWRILMSMERKVRQPTKSIHVSDFVIYPNNFLKKAPVRTSTSKLVFGCDSPGNFHPLFRLPSVLGTPRVPFPKGKQEVFSTWIKRSHLLRTLNPYLGGGRPSITPRSTSWRRRCFPAGREQWVCKRERAALSRSKNSWLRKEIFRKLSLPRDLSMTLFNVQLSPRGNY